MRRSERSPPSIPEGRTEPVSFCPELIAWWDLLCRWSRDLTVCHRWLAAAHPPPTRGDARALDQRSIPTLALCLAGTVRIEGPGKPCDLLPGEALLIAPGAWHRHAPLRPGSVVYRQGFILGRSDFFLMDGNLHLVATIPAQPSRRIMEEALLEADDEPRRLLLAELLATLPREAARPRAYPHPSVLAMIYAMQNTLHLPNATDAVVRASGMSRAQAYRWFRTAMGAGIATVRKQQRRELAEWLRTEGIPPKEITRRGGLP